VMWMLIWQLLLPWMLTWELMWLLMWHTFVRGCGPLVNEPILELGH
jgi:hypothetical protein